MARRAHSSTSLAELVRRMKGASSYELNRYGGLSQRFNWQDGYWAESLSPAHLDAVAQYVREQRTHHDDSHPAERWTSSLSVTG